MPVYEFQCEDGHVVEDLVPSGTKEWPCHVCIKLHDPKKRFLPEAYLAYRILSPTRTDFEFADKRK